MFWPFTRGNSSARTGKVEKYADCGVGEDLPEGYDFVGKNFSDRRAGVVMHPTSLPGSYGTGEIGEEALRFIDWLEKAGMSCWQVLPLVPPDEKYFSPYSSVDALCGSPLLISIDSLIEDGLLDAEDAPEKVPVADADFASVTATKQPLLDKAAARLLKDPAFESLREQMAQWRKENEWVENSALFDQLRLQPELKELGTWWTWPEPLRFREAKAIAEFQKSHSEEIDRFIAIQFIFAIQWARIKEYANEKGIAIIGDMPIYVGGQSADVWGNQRLFSLGKDGSPELVSGVPPDAFSETGQLWGQPLYDWKAHDKEKYAWWAQRLSRAFQLYNECRVDHFRGFAGFWAVEATQPTAMVGVWKKGPGISLFKALNKRLGNVPILAEDLGVITEDVIALRKEVGAPGMVVLQFAFGGGPDNTHLPHNHYINSLCYPGTHDNETSEGWFKNSCTPKEEQYLRQYLGLPPSGDIDIAGVLIQEAFKSVSTTSLVMMQDILRLDNSARMNSPGKAEGNWAWRIGESGVWSQLEEQAVELRRLAKIYNRLPAGPEEEDDQEEEGEAEEPMERGEPELETEMAK